MSALEALCNAAIGLIVSWAATFFILGYSASGLAAVNSRPCSSACPSRDPTPCA